MIRPCMTAAEYALWMAANRQLSHLAPTPCIDCPASFAAEMRQAECCNGEPGVGLRGGGRDTRQRALWRAAQRRRTARRRLAA